MIAHRRTHGSGQRSNGVKKLNRKAGTGYSFRKMPELLASYQTMARVAREERHAFLPAWLVRLLYCLLIRAVAWAQRRSLSLADYVGRSTVLDEVLPRWDHSEFHHVWFDASLEETWAALFATTGREVRLLRPLMALRRLPAWLVRRSSVGSDPGEPLFADTQRVSSLSSRIGSPSRIGPGSGKRSHCGEALCEARGGSKGALVEGARGIRRHE